MDHPQPSTSGIEGVRKKHKVKSFKTSWLDISNFKEWLTSHSDGTKAYCTVCDKVLACGKSELNKHAARKYHIENLEKFRINNPSALLSTHSTETISHLNKVKIAEIRLAAFYAEHDIALQTIEHMIPLIKDICSESQVVKDLSLSRKKCNKVIRNILGKRETEKIIQNLIQQKFSVLIDETTTIANEKFLCILVKYVSPNNKMCITQLLELIKLDATDCSAEKVYSVFEQCLKSKNIPLTNIVGMARDNASVMIGVHDSFVTRLKKEVPALIVLKCTCHSPALVASKATSKLPDSCENLLHAISTYFSTSSNRSAILCEFQEFIGVETNKMFKLSGIRWLVLQKCVIRLLDNWEVLKHYFNLEIIENKNKSAQFIFENLNDDLIKAYMLFLKYSLYYFKNFNALFQSRKILIHRLFEISEQLIKQIGQNFLLPKVLQNISENLTDPRNFLPLDDIYVGPECQIILTNKTPEFVKEVKSKCLDFYVTAVNEMIKRLPFNDVFFRDLKFLDSKFALFDKERNVQDLTNVAISFGTFDISALVLEWRILPTMFSNADKDILANLDIDVMWKKILETKNVNDEFMFPNLEKLVDAVLSLPHSNAEAERIFSIVTDMKNEKRNRLSIESLSAICKMQSSFQAQNVDCRSFQVDSRHLELHNSQNLYIDNNEDIDE